ncbi:MAG: hypothetical protein JOZ72_05360 [Alphaproteobacteria bacterium]|nr:hypothetical protein [Alphaproteobacteria bacterium]
MCVPVLCRALAVCTALLGTAASAAPAYQVVHSFGGKYGAYPSGDLQQDKDGNLYGTTHAGGVSGGGTIFKLDTAGTLSVLYSFAGGADGRDPEAGVFVDQATGDLYGTTTAGGGSGNGGVFRVTAAGEFKVLHDFHPAADGSQPYAPLTRDGDGNLYGTTYQDGPNHNGTIFKVAPDGTFSILHAFIAQQGGGASGHLERHGASLYGISELGGSGSGTLWRTRTDGSFALMHTFNWGVGLAGGPVRDSAGNLYGPHICCDNNGQIYVLNRNGELGTLYAFTGGADGRYPGGTLLMSRSGELLGTTNRGGDADMGVIFQLDLQGKLKVLHSFTGAPQDGATANGGLIKARDGKLYGTTQQGGTADKGVIFSVRAR